MFKKQKATRFVRSASRAPAGKAPATGKTTAAKKAAAMKPATKSAAKSAAKSATKPRATSARAARTHDVAVWDIDVHSGFVNRVLDAINRKQKLFRFVRIEATVPMGLTMSGRRTREIIQKLDPKTAEDPQLENSVWAEDIYPVARPILRSTGTDLLVCLLAPLIADRVTNPPFDRDGVELDFFSVSSKRIILVSAYELRGYAAKAGRSFEACLALLIVAQVLAEYFDLEEHDDTRGCIMDYCDDRKDIVVLLKKMEICPHSLEELPDYARASVLKIIQAIREYTP